MTPRLVLIWGRAGGWKAWSGGSTLGAGRGKGYEAVTISGAVPWGGWWQGWERMGQGLEEMCDPIDGSPPASPVPGILQARTLEWVASSFSNA